MKEEKILKQKIGSESGFSVPERYFSTFNDRIMSQLPEGETKEIKLSSWTHLSVVASTSTTVRRWSVAACIALVVGLSAWKVVDYSGKRVMAPTTHEIPAIAHHQSSAGSQATSTDTFDEAVDYVMYDNQDIYASLMSERD